MGLPSFCLCKLATALKKNKKKLIKNFLFQAAVTCQEEQHGQQQSSCER
jgi:hypothetical protein